MPSLGWASTRLLPETAEAYAAELERLRAALTVHRVAESQDHVAGGGGRRSSNLLPAACGCGRRIRIARATLMAGPILCGLCGRAFVALEADDR
jgi:hypothetical protein